MDIQKVTSGVTAAAVVGTGAFVGGGASWKSEGLEEA